MLTQENYKDLMTQVNPFSEILSDELDKIANYFTQKHSKSYTIKYENHSKATIEAYVQQILTSGKLTKETKIYTKIALSYWKISQGIVEKERSVSFKIFHIINETEIVSQKINKEQFSHWDKDPKFILISSNIPHRPFPHVYDRFNIIKSLSRTIFSTAPFLEELKNIEWRYEGIHLYKIKEVTYLCEKLHSIGFKIDLHPPYILVEKCPRTEKFSLYSRQAIGVSIPLEASIEENATLKIDNSSYDDNLSVHNILVRWRDQDKKISLPLKQNSDLNKTVDQVLEEIWKELVFVAKYGSLIKRYAHKITFLDKHLQEELLGKLIDLGYDAKLDIPFINREFVGISNGVNQHFYNQYILIDLP